MPGTRAGGEGAVTAISRLPKLYQLLDRVATVNETHGPAGKPVVVDHELWHVYGSLPCFLVGDLSTGFAVEYRWTAPGLLAKGATKRKSRHRFGTVLSHYLVELPPEPVTDSDEIDWLAELLQAVADCDAFTTPIFPGYGSDWREVLVRRRQS